MSKSVYLVVNQPMSDLCMSYYCYEYDGQSDVESPVFAPQLNYDQVVRVSKYSELFEVLVKLGFDEEYECFISYIITNTSDQAESKIHYLIYKFLKSGF